MKKKRKGKDRMEEGKEGEKEQESREDLIKEQRHHIPERQPIRLERNTAQTTGGIHDSEERQKPSASLLCRWFFFLLLQLLYGLRPLLFNQVFPGSLLFLSLLTEEMGGGKGGEGMRGRESQMQPSAT